MPTIQTTDVGECYRAAYQMLLGMPDDAVLVHGYPRLTRGEHQGRKFGHAWVETEIGDGVAIVHDHQSRQPIPAMLYYHVGQIKPAECKRYTLRQALRLALRTERYGPWGKVPKDVLFAKAG